MPRGGEFEPAIPARAGLQTHVLDSAATGAGELKTPVFDFSQMTEFETHSSIETFLLPTDAHNVKKHRVIKTF